jgi:hypothetical protein
VTGTLYHFGYKGLRPADLPALLEPVDLVLDVRLKKYSADRAFSTWTHQTIEAAGCRYLWAPALGNLDYRTGGIRIADTGQLEPLVLEPLRSGTNVALMCVCPDVAECHRAKLIEAAEERLPGLEVLPALRFDDAGAPPGE